MSGDQVLVTGAGGFIGGRVATLLGPLTGQTVKAGVSRRRSASRAFPAGVQTVVCDVRDSASLDAALQGVSAVVHCARGHGDDATFAQRTTELLLQRSRSAGVKRLVLVSSVAVYGAATGEVEEDTPPVEPVTAYGRDKRAAEVLCREQARDGVPTTVLRPTLVYGPGSRQWTTPYLARFASRRWRQLGAQGEGRCNLVFVDDLARMVAFALRSDLGPYVELNANGPEIPTWNSYLERFNAALDHPPLPRPRPWRRSWLMARRPVRLATRWLLKRSGRAEPRVDDPALAPLLRALCNDLVLTPSRDELELFSSRASFSMDRAARLGFTPLIAVDEGLSVTAEWARRQSATPKLPADLSG